MSVISNNILAGASGQAGGAAGGYAIERSLRLNRDDSAYLNKNFSSDGNRKTFTYSLWVKKPSSGASETGVLLEARVTGTPSSDSDAFSFRFNNSDKIQVADWGSFYITTSRIFRDPSAWYHLVLAVDTTQASNNIKLYVNGELDSQGTYTQNTDTRVNAGSGTTHEIGARTYGSDNYYLDGYLADVHFIDGQALTPTDFGEFDDNGVWQPKAYAGSYGTNGFKLNFSDNSSDAALGTDSSGNNNDWTVNNIASNSINYANETTTASSGTVSNGTENPYWIDFDPVNADLDYDAGSDGMARVHDGSLTTEVYWTGNLGGAGNVKRARFDLRDFPAITSLRVYGGFATSYVNYKYRLLDSSKTEISGTEGTFGAINWHSIPVSGSPRYLEISCLHTSSTSTRHRTYAIEVNGTVLVNGNPSNIDSLLDSPTNGTQEDTGLGGEVSGNYATLNPLEKHNTLSPVFSNGNLEITDTGQTGYNNAFSTIGVSSGKWYVECTNTVGAFNFVGIQQGPITDGYIGNDAAGNGWSYAAGGYVRHARTNKAYGSVTYGDGDVIGIALDLDSATKTLTFYKNGTSLGIAYSGSELDADVYHFGGTLYTTNDKQVWNFGQRPFAYTAPSGFKALCTANLSDPTIADGSTAMDVVTYAGNNSTQVISGLEFSPDLVWLKRRSNVSHHHLYDIVRGATKRLQSSTTTVESTAVGGVTSFDSNGWTMGNDGDINGSSNTFVGWTWDAGDSNTSITAGSLNSSAYDQSQTWSTYGTFDNNWSNSAYHWDDVFNTILTYSGAGSLYVDGTTKDTWNLSSSYAVSNTIKVYTYGPTEITINEGLSSEKIVTSDGGNTFHYYEFSFTGNVESVGVRHASGGGIYLMGIWFDDKQLVDDTETPTNVPSIASTVRANPSAGFSIVSYTGTGSNATVGHGLNAAPEFMFLKNRDGTQNWQVYHSSIGPTKYLNITTLAEFTNSNRWQDTAPTSSVFSIGTAPGLNTSTANIIAYCFAPVEGYSAFGSYTGNGSADGSFVYTGFSPRWIMTKPSSAGGDWMLWDTARHPSNTNDATLSPNSNGADTDGAGYDVDILSNGFKFREFGSSSNASGVTYIYAAFAENSFKTARAR